MTSVTSISGLVTGIDWESTIQQLMAVEAAPLLLLEDRKQEYETKLSMWQQLNTRLLALESTAENFITEEEFLARIATSSDTDAVAVSATGEARPGTHIISSITSLARSNNYVSGTGYASPNDTFGQGAGSFIINLANHPDGAKTITLTYGTDYSATTSLDEFTDLINSHPDNDGLVNASIINDGSANPYKLVITASHSGTDYSVTSITDTSTGLNMAEGLTAQDCVFNIDSINVTKSENQIDDVIEGMTFTLLNSGIASPVIITVENDTATVKTNINSIVNSYNDLKTLMNTVSNYDSENEVLGPLLGDGNLSSIRYKMDQIISSTITGLPSNATYNSLASIGVKTSGATGLLSVDNTVLTEALEDDFDAVADIFCEKVTTDNNSVTFEERTNTKTEPGSYTVVVNYDASGNITSATINGNAAQVLGTLISGAEDEDEEGLLLKFNWPGSGSQETATITLSLGANAQFDKEVEFITNEEYEEGEVYWAEKALNTTIENLDEQIEAMEERLAQKEERMRREFNQLEVAISRLQTQSQYLQAQLSGL